MAPGTYSVTVRDGNDCIISAEVTITAIANLSLSSSVTNVNCNGEANGRIDLIISNGAPPLIINWSNGASTEDLTNLPAGTYTVTVTD
ncbi:MAG: adhesin, partial [Pseudomonadota bacterium]